MEQGDTLAAGAAGEAGGEGMTISSLRKSILVLEKAINKNRDMRTKFSQDPEK